MFHLESPSKQLDLNENSLGTLSGELQNLKQMVENFEDSSADGIGEAIENSYSVLQTREQFVQGSDFVTLDHEQVQQTVAESKCFNIVFLLLEENFRILLWAVNTATP